jgi:hypothetical protein
MIAPSVKQGVDTGRRQRYAIALADLWAGLGVTLSRLEALAEALGDDGDDDALEELPKLQYSLHRASELALGIVPPAGAEAAHAELRSALAEARDATGDVAAALADDGAETAAALVHEWRGALFRVRLTRHLLVARPAPPPAPPEQDRPFPWTPLAGAALVALGAFAFTSGAVLGLWPLWAAGLMLVAGGFVAHRP